VCLVTLDASATTIWGVSLSVDGHPLAAGAADGAVRVWETVTGQLLTTLRGHVGMVRDVALSGDGGSLATGGAADGTLRIWSLAGLYDRRDALPESRHKPKLGRLVTARDAHDAGVWGVAVSFDGQLIATGGADGKVRLWHASNGSPLATLQGLNGEVLGVGLSADARLIAAGGADGILRLWEPLAENAASRTLQAERRYARADISGLTGVTDAQRATLLALGTVEQDRSGVASAGRSPARGDGRPCARTGSPHPTRATGEALRPHHGANWLPCLGRGAPGFTGRLLTAQRGGRTLSAWCRGTPANEGPPLIGWGCGHPARMAILLDVTECAGVGRPHSPMAESFRDMLLRCRGRSGLTQRELANRLHVNRRSVQEWETGASFPSAERLEALIRLLLETDGLTAGQEAAEAEALSEAVQRAAPHAHAPFDAAWFARLMAERGLAAPGPAPAATKPSTSDGGAWAIPGERRQDWGEAPDTTEFVGRADELRMLSSWVLHERCRVVAVLGMGGMGKTSLAAKVAREVAPNFERVYWRSLRDALPSTDWLAGAVGFLSDQQLVPAASESERLAALLGLLREQRCLLVLDNLETLFEPGQQEGRYRAGMAGYGRLLQAAGGSVHQSCLFLTSREAPPELAALAGDAVRSLPLGGLGPARRALCWRPRTCRVHPSSGRN
jgi:transcriptional regulator with XRE-family HTH domain